MAGAESEELVLLERVFLRIGSAETDDQLENVLGKFLPPVLLKLSSPAEGVRKKVMELLIHVNKRVKTRPLLKLPVRALLTQYLDPESTSFIINFTIIYLKMGFPRLSIEEQVNLVPDVLNALEGKPLTHQDSLMLLIVPLLGKMIIPTDPVKRKALFGLNEKPMTSKHFLAFCLDMILLPYSALSPQTEKVDSTTDVSLPVPAGMSEYSYKRVTGDNPLKPEELEQIKLGIVKFLANDIFSNEQILIHLIIAAADTRFSIANLADMELKKIAGLMDWSNPELSMPLYVLFLGFQTDNVKAHLKKSPANTRIRLKLLTYLCRVNRDGFFLPLAIKLIFDSLYGVNTNPKLKTLALNFTSNLVKEANKEKLSKVANVIKSGLIKVTNEGEPAHQGQAFVILGQLACRFPEIVYHDVGLLDTFYRKLLDEADSELKLQVREGTLSLILAYKHSVFPDEIDRNDRLNLMYNLLKFYVKCDEPIVRFVAVRSLAVIFPSDHVPSKYLLLLATGDSKDDVFHEAFKSLYGTSRKAEINMSRQKNDFIKMLPPFVQMTNYIYNESQIILSSKNAPTYGNHVLPFPANVYLEILIYLRLCLTQNLDVPQTRDVIKHPNEFTPIIKKHLEESFTINGPIEENPLLQYVYLIRELMIANPVPISLCCMVEVIGCVPSLYVSLKCNQWLIDQLSSVKEDVREHAAILYSVLINESLSVPEFENQLKTLITKTSSKSLETQCGAVLALGHCVERKIVTLKMKKRSSSVKLECFLNIVETLVSFLSHSNVMVLNPACIAIGLIAKSCSLPIQDEDLGSPDAKKPSIEHVTKITKIHLVNKFFDIMNNVKISAKTREKAARSLGLLCVGEKFPFTKEVMQGFLNTIKDTKDVEVHFSIGESLVMCVQGTNSPDARDAWSLLPEELTLDQGVKVNDDYLDWLLKELLRCAETTHPNSKQASSIWLLALTKSCIDREPIKNQLRMLQNVFMNLLGENNDIVQDVASKGLCLIYDYSKSEELLTALVDQLTSGRRHVMQVDSDTKLFEEGQLGKSPTGGNLSTYKELCSLASDLNKPDLIYQFMHLANHNAIWNSKKGAAYGFQSIAEKCGEHLQQHLGSIIPKLYRYQYDPSPNLQASMQNIWHVLVLEPQKMLDIYHQEVLRELLTNLNSGQYRVRQSCCLALQDFLKGAGNRSIHDSVHVMDELWNKLFRVMDDHHEQTRIAATKTTRILSKLCIRGCDANQGKSAIVMMEAILPVLLNNGINSPVADIRIISLQAVSELVGSAGKQLKPFLPKLIPALLLANGELESSKLSYLSAQYGAQSQIQEAVDSARATIAKSHFTMETVSKCLQYADNTILEELVPKVVELMKGSIGLGTRVACAHFITLLTVQLKQDLQPYTGKFLAALVNGLTDRNASIRKHYAVAIGHLVGSAKESSLEKLFNKIKLWYFEREDDSIRSACAYTIQSIGNQNQEIFKSYSENILPLVFFAMHAEKTPETQNTLEIWNDIWAEHSPGTETGIRQNIEAISDILKTALESPSWNMKAQAANAVATVASKLGATMDVKYRNTLITILVTGLNGRTWNGKDKLLKALATISNSCKDVLKSDSEIDLDSMINAVLKEARKDEIVYKISTLEALGEILSALEYDRFEEVYNIVQGILTNESSTIRGEDEDSTNEEVNKNLENKLKLVKVVYELLGKAWPKDANTQKDYRKMFVEHCLTALPTTTRSIQVAIIAALCNYVDKLTLLSDDLKQEEEAEALNRIIEDVLKALSFSLGITKHTRLRKEALNVYASLGKRLKESAKFNEFELVSLHFTASLDLVQKDNQPEIKSRLVDLKTLFKKEN